MALSHVRLALIVSLTATCANDITDPVGSTPPAEEAVAILFVGNSLTQTNDLPAMVEALLEDGGHGPADVRASAFPNYGLPDHWVTQATRDAIDLGGWDYVVLQQGPSATEGRPFLLEYTPLFAGEIAAVGAETALYMVWPSTARSFDFDGVSDSYATAAEQVGGVLFPAGEAWRTAWETDPDLAFYGPDGFHPSRLGSFLAALTIYQRITGVQERDVPALIRRGTSSVPIEDELADLLFEAARLTNERFTPHPAS